MDTRIEDGRVIIIPTEADKCLIPVEIIDEFLDQGHRDLVIDLGQITRINSQGVGDLVSCHRRATKVEATLSLTHVSDGVRALLEFLGADAFFDIK